jgi:hypothetical protein
MKQASLVCRILLGMLIVAICGSPSWAGEVTVQNDGSTTWQAGVDGVEIEWNADGSIKRIYSRYSTPVEFPDRRGIDTAQKIAEEKAKAAIVRFMNQSVSSTRVVTEVQADLNRATQERQTGSGAIVRKVDQRTLVEALTEVTASFATGKLSGVIVLEKGYDDKTQEAWVVVGISQKTIKAARDVQDTIADPNAGNRGAPDSMGRQPSEIRRSHQKDW